MLSNLPGDDFEHAWGAALFYNWQSWMTLVARLRPRVCVRAGPYNRAAAAALQTWALFS